jgi:small-conductance mechanosensitive channel
VADFNWRATSIRTLTNSIVIVPNAKLAQATVTNFHKPSRDLAVLVEVGVHYLSHLDQVERVTLAVAKEVLTTTPGAVRDVDPLVRFHTLGSHGLMFTVVLRGQEYSDQFLLKHEFIKRLHARYAAEGIVLPFSPVDPRAHLPAGRDT